MTPALHRDSLAALTPEQIAAFLDELPDDEAAELFYNWPFWARPAQRLPAGDWIVWLLLAGRGFGKSRTGAETVRVWARDFDYVNLIGPTASDARDAMIEGESGLLAICPNGERPLYEPSKARLTWPNGGRSLIFTADEPERLRGKQHTKLWCDELAAWRYPEAWDQAMFGLRVGAKPQAVVTTTPRPTKIVKELLKRATTHVTRGTTFENRHNLAATYETIIEKYKGTRLGRQELLAEVLEDNPGALWTRTMIDAARVEAHPALSRIVVAVDPAVTASEDSDETGIGAVGMDERYPAHFYVLDDRSLIGSPREWAVAATTLYHERKADRLVGETNNGGDMIEATIRNVDPNVSYRAVTATRGKLTRAEPIAALYEQGRVHHVGCFDALENQLCDWTPTSGMKSPDRMDWLVWALTELTEADQDSGFLHYIRQQQPTPKEEACPTPTSQSLVSPWHSAP